MGIHLRASEFRRTCEACGQEWLVPRWAVRPWMRGMPLLGLNGGPGARTASAGATMADAASIAASNAALAESAGAFHACPKCGSNQYTQRPVR